METILTRTFKTYSYRPLLPSTVYWIGLRAHNELGASEQASMLVKTRPAGPGVLEDGEDIWDRGELEGDDGELIVTAKFPLVPVLVGLVTAAGLILLCLVDIACCCLWDRGLAHTLCGGRCAPGPRQTKPAEQKRPSQPQEVFNIPPGGDGRLATVRGGRRTLDRHQQRAHEGLYDAPEWGHNPQESLLPGNLYEATPDHSILKNGLAKSLSRVDIAEAASAPPQRVRMANQSSRRRTPGSSRQTPVSRKARARKSQQDPHQVGFFHHL